MFKNKSWSSKAAIALLAGTVVLTGLGLETALAAPKAPPAKTRAVQKQEITDFSARRRGYGYYNNNAAAIGTFLAIAGATAAIAASRRHRYRPYAYGGYPGYYGGPRYYAPQPYYGGPYGYYGRPYRYW